MGRALKRRNVVIQFGILVAINGRNCIIKFKILIKRMRYPYKRLPACLDTQENEHRSIPCSDMSNNPDVAPPLWVDRVNHLGFDWVGSWVEERL